MSISGVTNTAYTKQIMTVKTVPASSNPAFEALLNAPDQYTAGTATSASSVSQPASASPGLTPPAKTAAQSFTDYMKETPMQHYEDSWLKAHNLTKEEIAAMPPAQQDAIYKQMAADIKKQIQQDAQNKSKKTDIVA